MAGNDPIHDSHDHESDHGHIHDHEHDPHAPSPDDPPPGTEWEFLEKALSELLGEADVFSEADIQRQMDFMDSRNEALGARVVARAWTDPAFRDRLIEDPRVTLRDEMDVDIGTLAELEVVENTPDVHHVVVCTLCSCYPRNLLGIPPAWYKSRAYRSRVVHEPRKVLEEFGTTLPDDMAIRVLDSTADLRYLVIPSRPEGTDDLTVEQLEGLVTRDSMIGTATAKNP
jgi:nitrile hydratase